MNLVNIARRFFGNEIPGSLTAKFLDQKKWGGEVQSLTHRPFHEYRTVYKILGLEK